MRYSFCPLMISTVLFLMACQPPTVPLQGSSNFRFRGIDFTTQQTRTLHTNSNGARYIGGVPYVSQGEDNTCGQAVMSMALQFWGQDISYQQVVNESNPINVGTSYTTIQNYLREKGLTAQSYYNANLDQVIAEVDAGRPAIVLLEFDALFFTHYVLVVGYNARRNTLIIHESQSAPYVEIDVDEFLRLWEAPSLVSLPVFGGKEYQRLLITVDRPELSLQK
jgi:hypothetical protein